MADTITTNYSFVQPDIGASVDTWGGKLNANWLAADTALKAVSDKADANESAITALDFTATAISYDPSNVSLTAVTTQGAIDELCTLPPQSKVADYTLAATDVGGVISISSGTVTVPPSVFSTGDVVVIYNDAADDRAIARGVGVTMYWINGANADRTLSQRGLATVVCVGANTFVITGQGLV